MSATPVKVLFFYPYNKSMTGGPRVLLNFMQRINRQVIDPVVVLPSHNPLEEALKEINTRVEVFELPEILRPADEQALKYNALQKLTSVNALVKYNRQIRDFIKKENISLVWVRNIKGVLFTALGARMAKVPLIWDIGLEKESKGLVKGLHWYGLNMSAVVITEAVSQQKNIFGSYLYNKFKHKIRTINPGITEERIDALKGAGSAKTPGVFTVLTAGSVGERKNQMMLVKAAEILLNDYPALQVDIVGPASEEQYFNDLKSYIEANGLKANVVLHGWRDDVPVFMGHADAFVMCSQNEGIPYVIHEAMHAGLPVVVTNAGGMPDAVAEGDTGFVIPRNSVTQLVEKLKFLIENPAVATAMGVNAQKRAVEEFSAAQWYTSYEKLILELTGKK